MVIVDIFEVCFQIKMEEIGADPNKITAYMPETKACCLRKLRKEKLDRILNLKSEPRSVSMDPEKHANDLFLISRLKELNNCNAESNNVKTEVRNELITCRLCVSISITYSTYKSEFLHSLD